jgi:hypothetical protein
MAGPDDIILPLLREMRAEFRDRFDRSDRRFDAIEQRLDEIESAMSFRGAGAARMRFAAGRA